MRAKKAFVNTVGGLIYEVVSIVCALILPRLILTSFGSDYNGVTNALTQFLGVIALFQAGIGGVTRAALYKPLAGKDRKEISIIIKTAESFLRKACFLFVAVVIAIAIGYPLLVRDRFAFLFTAILVIIMSLSTFAQYFFGQTYQFLLYADQRQGFISIVNSLKLIISTIIAAILIKAGFGMIEVQMASTIVFIGAALYVNFYTRKKYGIMSSVQKDDSKLSQRWDNFAQACANFVCDNTDIVILSIVTNVFEVSVYSIYNLVMKGVFNAFNPFTQSLGASFGNMFAKNQHKVIEKNLRLFEQMVFALSTFLLGVTAATIIPFVMLYTRGVTDVDYIRTVFAGVFVVAVLFKCYRTPYITLVNAVGHFKQTKKAAIIEAIINISASLILVFNFGIVGVITGTLLAYAYRTIAYAWYVSNNIVKRPIQMVLKRIALSLVEVVIIAVIPYILRLDTPINYIGWLINVLIISMISLVLVISVEFIFYRTDLIELYGKIFSTLKNIRKRDRTDK